jgi:uncharacterized protein (DUF433 family)
VQSGLEGVWSAIPWCPETNLTDWRERIVSNREVCGGVACVRGTRIPVAVILDNLASGESVDQMLCSYPSLHAEDIRAAIAFAADLAGDRVVELPAGDRCPAGCPWP